MHLYFSEFSFIAPDKGLFITNKHFSSDKWNHVTRGFMTILVGESSSDPVLFCCSIALAVKWASLH